MKYSSIIDNTLWIRLDFSSGTSINRRFMSDPANKAHLAAQLLLYDRIIIPTKDFGIIPVLDAWMGTKNLEDALTSGAIALLWIPSVISYLGNGHGLKPFVVHPVPGSELGWEARTMFAPPGDAIEVQLEHSLPTLAPSTGSKFADLVFTATDPLAVDNEFIERNVLQESYRDVLNEPAFQSFITNVHGDGAAHIDLARLRGIDANQLRVRNLAAPRDGIDLLLRLAEINLELSMGAKVGDCDLEMSSGADRVLRKKMIRAGIEPGRLSQFMSLLDLRGIPDIRPAIASGEIAFADLWKLRNKRDSASFRKWIRTVGAATPREIEKAYVSSLESKPFLQSLPLRILRFAATTLVGMDPVIGTAAGVAAGVADSFFLDKFFGGYNPSVFLDGVSALPAATKKRLGKTPPYRKRKPKKHPRR